MPSFLLLFPFWPFSRSKVKRRCGVTGRFCSHSTKMLTLLLVHRYTSGVGYGWYVVYMNICTRLFLLLLSLWKIHGLSERQMKDMEMTTPRSKENSGQTTSPFVQSNTSRCIPPHYS